MLFGKQIRKGAGLSPKAKTIFFLVCMLSLCLNEFISSFASNKYEFKFYIYIFENKRKGGILFSLESL